MSLMFGGRDHHSAASMKLKDLLPVRRSIRWKFELGRRSRGGVVARRRRRKGSDN